MDLNEVSVFVKVVQAGSFTKAAKELGMPNSTVSAKISALERRLGVTLIQRTTRQLNVTAAGEAYFRQSVQGLQQIEAAENELLATRGEPQGILKITAPVELGATLLPQIVADYLKVNSSVKIDIHLSDERVDLLAGNFDLALRAGELRDSTLIAKKLGQVSFGIFASPKYLKANKKPADPQDLKDHTCLQFSHLGASWKLTNGKVTRAFGLPGKVVTNDLNMIKTMAIAGQGLALLPSFFCHGETDSGKLVRVLGDWRTNLNPVHFVYPAQKFVMPKVSAFIEAAAGPIRERLAQAQF